MRKIFVVAGLFLFIVSQGCATQHKVETKSKVEVAPIEIKPIHITIDLNIKIDRALDDFFGDLDKTAEGIYSTKSGTQSE